MRRKKDRSNGITALYERLSRDDDNAGESNSIVHQKQMLEDYAIKHGFRERIINLTSKEFDILALLIANPKRVFTYELITDLVWKEDCDFYSRKAIHNHISKLRKKLRFEPDLPNYIESVAGIGYKFEHL